ncbi:MAG: hypothetical protein A3C02_04435 [Candidatus Andersenbacteria bacterium RIFCSPHIGHO2_02_FULL_45_11]|uniref:Type II toxin-antitoxin system mRNA interferase toxin, RelE/StbE family n=1 Tax=Candidatus Andersenbacteria bacterium RIFCSPHIGHO2_12_FULL_45_11 TaxID=1797281 RepID=A0A1G1X2Q7_9BACT|nr:MAG: hypothetical protein A2805_02795 [Candidatus Andersenbacteria bacterium RIFCSPHIGHO2_01_FULL_46_36]OGY32157.1 MAG: hypothetical protein A3C02_04435 [Candidatus Andersenbacteria bacterium RIFCSPHIGHO2_02_FULL_45_11]OGY34306.1 MAG: hypothetical protein A3D99_04535 [Candidatus Andersenbacteria bacterium RIFCSPHIGHO2_12_FULL_45_11]
MQLRRHKRFEKQFNKLSPAIQQKSKIRIKLFIADPHAAMLKNHALKGSFEGERAISITGDIRIVFIELGNYEYVTFMRIGTHNQVY